jgi:dTMP kinase
MKFIVIEGIDGAGKSTQVKLLKEHFLSRGFKCEYIHFPRTSEPFFGELIARFLRGEFGSLDKVDPWLVAMLYAGDRKDASGIINTWLGNGTVVLLDRYTYSNIAYQCAKVEEPASRDKLSRWILDLEFGHFGIPRPDMNIFLDVPFSFTASNLLASRTGNDRYYLNGTRDIHEESLAFQKRVRDMYLMIAATDDNLRIVNCGDKEGKMLPPETIFGSVLKLIST